ncbi:MAG: efflux RND transporter periplasmic adaptor subunit [Firmicutes bacterium]|nr:efflux RND transporter periplasmic adaptor subunit [Bacillota bacterium]
MWQRAVFILFVVASVVGGGYYGFVKLLSPAAKETKGPIYATSRVVRGDISVGVTATGPLNPTQGGGIAVPGGPGPGPAPSASFVIEEVLAKDGDPVRQGQILVRLNGTDLEAQLKSKERTLETERKSLAALLGVPPSQLDDVDPSRGITLRAPIDGKVLGLTAKEGQEVKQGQVVARVVNDSRFRLTVWLTLGESGQLVPGQRVVLRFAEFDAFVPAEVTDVSPEPAPVAAKDLWEPTVGAPHQDQNAYALMYSATLEGTNEGLIVPGMRAYVGVPSGDSVFFVRYPAKVEGYADEQQVLSGANALVTRVHVREMQKVKEGAPLVSLAGADARDLMEERLDKVRQLEAEVQQLRTRLGELDVRASMDGTIGHIEARPGMTVQPGQWFGNIFDTAQMQLWTMVDDVDVLKIKQGAPVRVTVDAVAGKTFSGTVDQVAMMGKDDKGISRFQVSIKVQGGPELRPGMQAQAQIDAGSAKAVLLVPLEAIFEEDGKSEVEVLLPGGAAKVVPVELGLMNDRVAEVKSGLKEGDLVITGSTADLLPSQRIRSNGLLPGNGEGEGQQQGGAGGSGEGSSPGGANPGAGGKGP